MSHKFTKPDFGVALGDLGEIQSSLKLGYLGDGQVERVHGGDDFRHAVVLAEGLRGMHLLKKVEKDRDELPKSTRSV